jgi:excisionase family DNA binding protein
MRQNHSGGHTKERGSPPGKPFVSVGKASDILGVSETTLRHWTDEGRVKAFVTPGGHRRYSEHELRRFTRTHQASQAPMKVADHLEQTAVDHRKTAREYVDSALPEGPLPGEDREILARCGRELLDLVIRYVNQPARRAETICFVRQVGEEHGRILASLGFPLVDCVEAFIKHRNLLVEAATQFAMKGRASSDRAMATVPLVTRVVDEALVSLVAAHQRTASPSRGGRAGRRRD